MNQPSSSRRRFLQGLGLVTGALATGGFSSAMAKDAPKASCCAATADNLGPDKNFPARSAGATYMGDFAAPKIDKVKIAFIGVGDRGTSHLKQIATMKDNVEIVGVCDLYEDWAERGAKAAEEKLGTKPPTYTKGPEDYKRMLAEVKPDAVIISTSWDGHAQQCIDSMKAGAHAFVEVPMALTIEEMWNVVNTSEKTKKHCMMMENCNYGREELCFLNMVNQGIIGDLLHGEAAYIHELRFQMKDHEKRGTGKWRTHQWANRNGNLYPTHGLGPVSQYMNCARGDDMFARMTSFSSPALGHAAYAKKTFAPDHEWNKLNYVGGDISTSIIKTALGRTIMVQWDETSPRPYSRHNLIQGTLGTLAGYPTRVAGEKIGNGNYHQWTEGKDMDAIYEKYDHPLFKRQGELAKKMGGHGGMDYLMLFRMVECLQKGEPLDQNVYEGALWSAVGPMSEASVAQGGMPQVFPDFTRGDWKNTKPMPIIQ